MATQSIQIKPRGANLFTTGMPALYLENGTNIPYSGYGFDASTSEQIFVDFKVPFYLSGNLTVTLRWYSQTGQTSGAVIWGTQIAALTAGDAQSVLTDTLATTNTSSATTVNSTARGSTESIVTVTNLDSLAADDTVQMRVYRDAAAGGDTMTGDAIIFDIEVEYAATGGVGSGNVSNAGTSTDNAIARFDLATGQVIQNSVVTVDDTTGTVTLPAGASGKFVGGGAADCQELSADSAAITTTLTTVLTWALPGSGTYKLEAFLIGTISTVTGNAVNVNLAYSGTTTRAAYLVNIPQNTAGTTQAALTSTAINTTKSATVTVTTIGDPIGISVSGSITVSTSGNLTLQVSRSTSGSITIKAGSAGTSIQK